MADWTGEIVYETQWKFDAHRPPTPADSAVITSHWEAEEKQTWKLVGMPTTDPNDPTAKIYKAAWTITGSGQDYDKRSNGGEYTGKWDLNAPTNTWTIEFRIKDMGNDLWTVEQTSVPQNGLNVIDITETTPSSKQPLHSKLNRFEQSVPKLDKVEQMGFVFVIDNVTKGPIQNKGHTEYRPWSSLSQARRNSLRPWINHNEPLANMVSDNYGVRSPYLGQKNNIPPQPGNPWVVTTPLTGHCFFSWRLEFK